MPAEPRPAGGLLTAGRQRVAVLASVVLIALALGLPWTHSTEAFIPGWITPASCIVGSDGLMTCTGAFISPGMMTGSAALSGAGAVARVFLVAALVLSVVAWRRQESRWLVWASAGILLGALLTGLSAQGGQLAAFAAAALLAYAGLTGANRTNASDAPARA